MMLDYRDGEWRVSLDELIAGDVRAVFSVLFEPLAEFDLDQPPGTDPEPGYFTDLLEQMGKIEADLAEVDPDNASHEIVTSAPDLTRVTEEGKAAFMHCVEGGFHLGAEPAEIDANVATWPAEASSTSPSPTSSGAGWRPTRRRSRSSAMTSTGDLLHHDGRGLSPLGEAAVRRCTSTGS